MANVYVGFHDQRNSSRVLKPPGGGTSDIFGTDPPKIQKAVIEVAPAKNEVDATPKPCSESNDQVSNEEISKNSNSAENTDQEEKINNVSKPNSEDPKIENLNICDENKETTVTNNVEELQNEPKSEIKANGTTESVNNIIQQQEKHVEPEIKKTNHRIPPGGYSSGLW